MTQDGRMLSHMTVAGGDFGMDQVIKVRQKGRRNLLEQDFQFSSNRRVGNKMDQVIR